jgi:hypothetical protein
MFRSDANSDSRAYQQLCHLIITYECFTDGKATALDLAALLENHRIVDVKDPKDKVYALLGLSELIEGKKHDIVPDYNLQTTDIYEQVAKSVLEKSSTLDLLGIPKVMPRSPIGLLPSWVPDWSAWDFASSLCLRNMQGKYVFDFDATQTFCLPKRMIIKGHTLELSGHTFDRVCKVGRVFDPFPEQESLDQFRVRKYLPSLHALIIANDWSKVSQALSGSEYPTGERIMDSFIRTLFLGDLPNMFPTDSDIEHFLQQHMYRLAQTIGAKLQGPRLQKLLDSWYSIALRRPATAHTVISLTVSKKNYKQRFNLIHDAVGRTIHRKMIRTTKGYIGMGPRSTKEGDCVVLVQGGRVPLVLRPRDHHWELLGDCYLHGIMHGEGFEEAKCEGINIV